MSFTAKPTHITASVDIDITTEAGAAVYAALVAAEVDPAPVFADLALSLADRLANAAVAPLEAAAAGSSDSLEVDVTVAHVSGAESA